MAASGQSKFAAVLFFIYFTVADAKIASIVREKQDVVLRITDGKAPGSLAWGSFANMINATG